jgi:hypothetical protein
MKMKLISSPLSTSKQDGSRYVSVANHLAGGFLTLRRDTMTETQIFMSMPWVLVMTWQSCLTDMFPLVVAKVVLEGAKV